MFIMTGLAALVVACTSGSARKADKEEQPLTSEGLVKRGEYLVSAMGCDDCHTPKKMGPQGPELDLEHRFSGHPANQPIGKADTSVMKNGWVLFGMGLTSYVGPWGLSYAANITSDATGIGMWTEEQFLRAIRKGLSKGLEGNRPLLPPMPWFVYKNLTDEDLKAVFAYLKSTKPVKNVVPQPKQLKDL
jgi:mono/diheme cytochrome c family protein